VSGVDGGFGVVQTSIGVRVSFGLVAAAWLEIYFARATVDT
jgi:hypothetical protein